MKNSIRTELYKALTNKLFYISLAIGILFCAMDIQENRTNMQDFDEFVQFFLNSDYRIGTGHEGYSLFYLWMGLGSISRGAAIFYTVWPVLVSIPYGWSYMEDRRSGLYNQLVTRTSATTYYVSKYIAVFVSGGLAIALPMLLGLLGNAMFVPYAEIPVTFNLFCNQNFLPSLFYKSHWLYALVWSGMQFLCGGAAACLCLVVGTKLRYGVMAILTPYVLYVLLDTLIVSLRSTLLHDVPFALSPLYMVCAQPGWNNPAWLLFTMLALLIGTSFTLGYWQVVKHELA